MQLRNPPESQTLLCVYVVLVQYVVTLVRVRLRWRRLRCKCQAAFKGWMIFGCCFYITHYRYFATYVYQSHSPQIYSRQATRALSIQEAGTSVIIIE